ncbi:MAG: tryptophan synthase subunit beta [Candidatus Pacebacteria bacterium]|nr:tryptophan synthase subunit beta [Candidatus Paceibacterota bacterium]MDD5357135.1 tryptophan synthase subunit beta [Candidatus Paceibacterota bacterium]
MKRKEKQKNTYGGAYVPEMLVHALKEIEIEFEKALKDTQFQKKFRELLHSYSGRPTPLIYAENLTKHFGGGKLYLKNEGANHTGAHKITHCLGQALIAKRLGKKELIAETGAGQHGVATATVAAKFGFKCKIFMGEVDIARQRPNVFWMEQLGAEVISVSSGSKTLKDAVNEALKYWMAHSDESYYVIGSVLGPHPYPEMNRTFQSIIGEEIREQTRKAEKKLPDVVVACVGGGSNAIGAFYDFVKEKGVRLIGVEAGGIGKRVGENAMRKENGSLGIFQGYKSLFLQTSEGHIAPTHSVAAGLDYPGMGPELATLFREKRVELQSATDKKAVEACLLTAKYEGVIPALESSHALAYAYKILPKLSKKEVVVVNVSGRGDKDLFNLTRYLNHKEFKKFLAEEIQRYEK